MAVKVIASGRVGTQAGKEGADSVPMTRPGAKLFTTNPAHRAVAWWARMLETEVSTMVAIDVPECAKVHRAREERTAPQTTA